MRHVAFLLILIPPLALGGERPASAPPIDERLTGIEARLSNVESRVDALEGKRPASAPPVVAACPCPTGGKCICPADGCNCPGCPNHVQPNENARLKILGWGASWCGPCRVGESASRADGTWDRVLHYDWDSEHDKAIGQKLGVTSIPTILLVKDNKVIARHKGPEGYAEQIRQWIDNPAQAIARTASRPKDDYEPIRIARTSPAYSYGSTGYNPVQRCTVTRLNGQRWTWPGDLGSHLRSAHGFNPSGFSHAQLVTIHDNFHNTGQSGVSSGGYSRSPVVRFSAPRQSFPARVMRSFGSFCPTCPR